MGPTLKAVKGIKADRPLFLCGLREIPLLLFLPNWIPASTSVSFNLTTCPWNPPSLRLLPPPESRTEFVCTKPLPHSCLTSGPCTFCSHLLRDPCSLPSCFQNQAALQSAQPPSSPLGPPPSHKGSRVRVYRLLQLGAMTSLPGCVFWGPSSMLSA